MPLGNSLTERQKRYILNHRKKRFSLRQIAKKIGKSHTVVGRFLKNPLSYGKIKRSGRKSVVTDRVRRIILRLTSNSTISSSQIKDQLSLEMSRSTIDRVRRKAPHLQYKKLKAQPNLRPHHIEKRKKFGQEHMTWNLEWRKVSWSDEKKFNLDGPDGLRYYWHDLRKDQQILSKRAMGGGGVMVWACFSWDFKGAITFVEGSMDAYRYRELLNPHLQQLSDHFGGNDWIFQQDNAPIHTARSTVLWLKSKNINVMDWPALSPDLNPIENLWGILARAVYANGKQYYSKEELKKAIQSEWKKIGPQVLKNLVESMPKRIYELITLQGRKTKY